MSIQLFASEASLHILTFQYTEILNISWTTWYIYTLDYGTIEQQFAYTPTARHV